MVRGNSFTNCPHYSATDCIVRKDHTVTAAENIIPQENIQGKRRFGCCDQHHKLFSSATAQH